MKPRRYELSDFEWSIIEPLLPNKPRGVPRWAKIGVGDRIFEAVSKAYDGDLQMIDSSSIGVHQHGANGKKGDLKKRRPPLGTTLEPAAWGAREAD